jgi:integrase
LKPLLTELDIEYKTLYATRHSAASIMVENNLPLTYVQKQLGHKKLSTTMDFYIKNGFVNESGRDERIDRLYC